MGQMRFVIPRPEKIVPGAAEWAYLASADGVPWECHVMIADEGVTIDRDTRESGYLYFPWKIADRGLVQLSSGSLMERQRPYNLPIELARGTVNRLRNQASTWQTQGMVISANLSDSVQAAMMTLARAATTQGDPRSSQDLAEEAIRMALDAADVLCEQYAQQVLAMRRSQQSSSNLLLGAKLAAPPT